MIRSQHKFAIKDPATHLYIVSDIDSGGMSVTLSGFQHADQWDTDDEAAAFLARIRERYQQPLEVVPC